MEGPRGEGLFHLEHAHPCAEPPELPGSLDSVDSEKTNSRGDARYH